MKSLAVVLEHLKSLAKFSSERLQSDITLVNSPWKCKGDKTTSGLWKELV